MGKKEFAIVVFALKYKTFVVYIISLSFIVSLSFIASLSFVASFSPILLDIDVYSFRRPQITGLIAKEIFIKVLVKYADFANIFFPDLASKLLKYTWTKNNAMKPVNG